MINLLPYCCKQEDWVWDILCAFGSVHLQHRMSEIKEREQIITDVNTDILENRLLNVMMYKNECNQFQDNYFLFSQHCMVAQEISFMLLTKQIHLHISIRYGIDISN